VKLGAKKCSTPLGKAGRAETPTDPAPLSMMETIVLLKPKSQWYKNVTTDQLVNEMNAAVRMPGVSNAWTMPIKNRIDMLTTGIRTPVGVKIYGADLSRIEQLDGQIESALAPVRGTRNVFAERTAGGYFLDFDLKRDQLARYGLSLDDAQMVLMNAIGGDNVTTTVEGRERYPVNVRYMRDFRSDIDRQGRVLVPAMGGQQQIPLAQIADLKLGYSLTWSGQYEAMVSGPAMLRNENGLLNGYVLVDVTGRDVGSYVDEAKRVVHDKVQLPPGTRPRAAEAGSAAHVVPSIPAAASQHEVCGENDADSPGGAVFGGGRDLAVVRAGLQHEHRRVGGADRADGRGRGDRRVHAAVSGPGVR
jgi:Cu(I)/Ag(I) efflux system membrane protein CusA/SilA